MWPFGKKNTDYDRLGLKQLRAGSEDRFGGESGWRQLIDS